MILLQEGNISFDIFLVFPVLTVVKIYFLDDVFDYFNYQYWDSISFFSDKIMVAAIAVDERMIFS